MILGYFIDLIIGDPKGWPHIVIGIGRLISMLESKLYKLKNKRLAGMCLVVLCLLIVGAIVVTLEVGAFLIHPLLFLIIDGIICFQCLATRSLRDETYKVYSALSTGDIIAGREAVSMVVGRDTDCLDKEGVIKACVETIAENTSDGIGAPLIYMGIGTGMFSCLYKAVNTMDSMIGYKNDKYLDFGRFAAKLDDVANYIPARITAILMVVASFLCGYDYRNAYRVFKRDRYKHASPNSAQTESVMAGALGIRLAGDAYYFGKLYKKEFIGDNTRLPELEDINRAHRLMYVTSVLLLILMILWRIVLWTLFVMATSKVDIMPL